MARDGRSRSGGRREHTSATTAARETLERRWFKRMTATPKLAPLVTGVSLADEPFHRWLGYKQAFAPRLVRLFLAKADGLPVAEDPAPLLDPFAGSGTFAIECARNGVAAIGVEVLRVMAFLAESRNADELPEPPTFRDEDSWQTIAERLSEPLHRAALIMAYARRHDSDGKPLRSPPPLARLFADVLEMIHADLRKPLASPVRVECGDARAMDAIRTGSIGGILTSPPYLSRHDYTRTTRPHEEVFAYWYGEEDLRRMRASQVRAHPKAHHQDWTLHAPSAVAEACEELLGSEEPKLAGVVRSYFEDMLTAMRECARVLRPGAPMWVVVAGARLRDVYVPADLILVDAGESLGLEVTAIRQVRRLVDVGRNLGSLTDVAPREALLSFRRGES